jgi:hypothetical protein
MYLFFSLFFSFGPARSLFLFHFPFFPLPPARPSLAGLSFFFFSLHRAAQPSSWLRFPPWPNSPPARPFSLSLMAGAHLLGSSPSSSSSQARTRAQSGRGTAFPAVRRPGPAHQGPLGHHIKPPLRALGSARPAAVASCLAALASTAFTAAPWSLSPPLPRYSFVAASCRRSSALG